MCLFFQSPSVMWRLFVRVISPRLSSVWQTSFLQTAVSRWCFAAVKETWTWWPSLRRKLRPGSRASEASWRTWRTWTRAPNLTSIHFIYYHNISLCFSFKHSSSMNLHDQPKSLCSDGSQTGFPKQTETRMAESILKKLKNC